jgi:hypothetical protein
MRSIGGLMVLLGAGSFVLHFLDVEFILLSWVNTWGVDVGYSIRIALIVVGAVILLLGNPFEKTDASPHA